MRKKSSDRLSGRERQLMDIIYRLGEVTVAEARDAMSDPPSYSSVRAILGILKNKGLARYEKRGRRYVYLPATSPRKARQSALSHIVQTFFDGSVEGVVAALLDSSVKKLSDNDLARLEKLIHERLDKERLK